MLYGICPFQSHSIAMLISAIESTKIDFPSTPYVSEQTKSLIRKMLTKDYCRRVGWVELFGSSCTEECSTYDSFPSDRNDRTFDYRSFSPPPSLRNPFISK